MASTSTSTETISAPVALYNGLAVKGADEDFGKMAKRLSTVEQGPFYAVRCAGWVLCSIGGVAVKNALGAA